MPNDKDTEDRRHKEDQRQVFRSLVCNLRYNYARETQVSEGHLPELRAVPPRPVIKLGELHTQGFFLWSGLGFAVHNIF